MLLFFVYTVYIYITYNNIQVNSLTPELSSRPTEIPDDPLTAIAESKSLGRAVIVINVTEQKQPNPSVVFSLDSVDIKSISESMVCLINLDIEARAGSEYLTSMIISPKDEICTGRVATKIPFSEPIILFEYPINDYSIYPYDGLTFLVRISLNTEVGTHYFNTDEITVKYNFDALNRVITSNGTAVSIERPYLIRSLLPIFGIIIIAVILALPNVKETSSFFEMSIAILFGLWASRQIIVPFEVQEPLWLDNIFLVLYSLMLIPVTVRVIAFLFSQQTEGEEQIDPLLQSFQSLIDTLLLINNKLETAIREYNMSRGIIEGQARPPQPRHRRQQNPEEYEDIFDELISDPRYFKSQNRKS